MVNLNNQKFKKKVNKAFSFMDSDLGQAMVFTDYWFFKKLRQGFQQTDQPVKLIINLFIAGIVLLVLIFSFFFLVGKLLGG